MEKNPHTSGKGNSDGEILFGKVLENDEIASCLINNRQDGDSDHYIALYQTGGEHLKGSTVMHSTGGTYVRAGTNIDPRDSIGNNIPAVYIEAETNDLVLAAPSGKVRIFGQNIEICSEGYDSSTGNIILSANETVTMSAQTIQGKAVGDVSFVCEGRATFIGKSAVNIFGAIQDHVDTSSSIFSDIAAVLRGDLTFTDFAKNTIKDKLFPGR